MDPFGGSSVVAAGYSNTKDKRTVKYEVRTIQESKRDNLGVCRQFSRKQSDFVFDAPHCQWLNHSVVSAQLSNYEVPGGEMLY